MSITIYTLTDPRTSHVRYVGMTRTSLHHRLLSHIRQNKGQPNKQVWIESLLVNGLAPIIEPLEVVSEDDWEAAEGFWITILRFYGFDLLNRCIGGKTRKGFVMDAEHRKRISAGLMGRKQSAETRAKISKTRMERYFKDGPRLRLKPVVMSRKGQLRGSSSPRSKLTEDQVLEIRSLAGKEPVSVMANRLGVSTTCVYHVLQGRLWQHLLPQRISALNGHAPSSSKELKLHRGDTPAGGEPEMAALQEALPAVPANDFSGKEYDFGRQMMAESHAQRT